MEEREEVREGAFVWKIDNYFSESLIGNAESPIFKFGKYDCYLDSIASDDIYHDIFINNSIEESLNYKTFCKLCLIDGRGNEFLATQRITVQSDKENYYINLMRISIHEVCLQENNLLPEGALTLRFTWCQEEECAVHERNTPTTESDINPGKEPTRLFEKLSEDLATFYESKTNTDCMLRVGDKQFPVHRALLSARSSVFAAMFCHDTSENQSGIVNISDVDATVMSDVLYYVYSGQIRGMSSETAAPIYVLADKYAFLELKDVCLNFLMRSLTVENVADASVLAHSNGESALENKVIQFIEDNSEEIVKTNTWKEFSKTKPALAIKYLQFALIDASKHKNKK